MGAACPKAFSTGLGRGRQATTFATPFPPLGNEMIPQPETSEVGTRRCDEKSQIHEKGGCESSSYQKSTEYSKQEALAQQCKLQVTNASPPLLPPTHGPQRLAIVPTQ